MFARKSMAALILIAIGAINVCYGLYRWYAGREGSIVLVGVGILAAGFGVVLYRVLKKRP